MRARGRQEGASPACRPVTLALCRFPFLGLSFLLCQLGVSDQMGTLLSMALFVLRIKGRLGERPLEPRQEGGEGDSGREPGASRQESGAKARRLRTKFEAKRREVQRARAARTSQKGKDQASPSGRQRAAGPGPGGPGVWLRRDSEGGRVGGRAAWGRGAGGPAGGRPPGRGADLPGVLRSRVRGGHAYKQREGEAALSAVGQCGRCAGCEGRLTGPGGGPGGPRWALPPGPLLGEKGGRF